MYFAERPLTYQHAPWIKRGSDSAGADEFQCSLAVVRLETFRLCRQRARPPNAGVMPAWKMQTVRGFFFHGNTKRIAFNVMSEQRTEENDHPGHGSDNDNHRNRCKTDDNFPSQGENGPNYECRMTKSESMTNDEARSVSFCHSRFVIPSSFVISASSFRSSFRVAQREMRTRRPVV